MNMKRVALIAHDGKDELVAFVQGHMDWFSQRWWGQEPQAGASKRSG